MRRGSHRSEQIDRKHILSFFGQQKLTVLPRPKTPVAQPVQAASGYSPHAFDNWPRHHELSHKKADPVAIADRRAPAMQARLLRAGTRPGEAATPFRAGAGNIGQYRELQLIAWPAPAPSSHRCDQPDVGVKGPRDVSYGAEALPGGARREGGAALARPFLRGAAYTSILFALDPPTSAKALGMFTPDALARTARQSPLQAVWQIVGPAAKRPAISIACGAPASFSRTRSSTGRRILRANALHDALRPRLTDRLVLPDYASERFGMKHWRYGCKASSRAPIWQPA